MINLFYCLKTKMNFNETQTKVLADFISKIGKGIEIEFRFGKYKYNTFTKKTEFKSNITTDVFYRLKMAFDKQNFEKSIVNTTEYIYEINNQKIKKVINNENVTYISKNTIKKYDIYDYDFRIAMASEKELKNVNTENVKEILVRKKERFTFKLPIGKFDLTIVNEIECEAELEIESKNYETVLHFLTVILRIINNNYFVISNDEKKYVLNEYNSILKTRYFVGAQPETLQKINITGLYKELYSVTDKADGDRMLLLIDNASFIYLIDNNMNSILKTNIKSKAYRSCIIDGECIRKDNKIYYYAFDLIAFNNTDLRGNIQFKLKERLNRLNDIVKSIDSNELYIVNMKKFYYKNVFLGSEVLLENTNDIYENDGLIFTPMNEPYPLVKKWTTLLKWKPSNLATIDFYSVKESDNVWKLYVQHAQASHNKESDTVKVLFDVNELCKVNEPIDVITYETLIPENTIDPTTNENYRTNTVIEYNWDNSLKRFVPLRTRWDKTVNTKKHGNFSSIACDIWNNIQNPINKELLFKFTTFNKNDFFFERMKKFHNKIKEYLYNSYSNNCNYLLELCSGRGGDLHKWKYNNIKNIDCYDNSTKNLDECLKRINQINFDKNINLFNLDLNSSNSLNIILKNKKQNYNVISCQFGLHYFFQNENTINNILDIFEQNISENGNVILTFIDNKELDKFFNGNKSVVAEQDNEIIYYLSRDDFNSKLKIVLNGNNILNDGSEEYIINFEKLQQEFIKRNFELVETKLFKELNNNSLSKYEQDISFLNRYCVFRKKQGNILKLPIIKEIVKENQKIENIDSIQINDYIKLLKIYTCNDLLDVMNCIEYKYKKYTNIKDLEIFDDITNIFKEKNINYNPVFVENIQTFTFENLENTCYFTYYKHIVEKNNNTDTLTYNNWYIILYNDKIVNFEIKSNNTSEVLQNELLQNEPETLSRANKVSCCGKNINNIYAKAVSGRLDQIRNAINKKITVTQLKEYLKEFNLKSSGTKQELIDRLLEFTS